MPSAGEVPSSHALRDRCRRLDGLDWVGSRPDYDAYVITHDETTHWTDGFVRYGATS